MWETLPASWICPACDCSNLSGEGICTNCGLVQGADEREVQEHRRALARDPEKVMERARLREGERRVWAFLIYLLAFVAVVVFVISLARCYQP